MGWKMKLSKTTTKTQKPSRYLTLLYRHLDFMRPSLHIRRMSAAILTLIYDHPQLQITKYDLYILKLDLLPRKMRKKML
jgi:hypothetical protein